MARRLAHLNVAVAKHPLDHPEMASFSRLLDPVNAHGPTPHAFTFKEPFEP